MMLVLRCDYQYCPSGQDFTLIAEGAYPTGDTLEIWDITDSTNEFVLASGAYPTLGVTTQRSLSPGSSPTTFVFQARIVNSSGTVEGKSYPVRVTVSLQANSSDQGYIPYYTDPQKGCVLMITGGVDAADKTKFSPELSLSAFNFSSPVYQFSYGNPSGVWTETAFTSTPTFTMPPLDQDGLWHVTGYVKEEADPDSKPYLAKAHTYAIAVGQPISTGWSISQTGAAGLGDEISITAPSGYTCYEFWVARMHSNNVHSDSTCQTSNVLDFWTSELGTYRIQAFGMPSVTDNNIDYCCAGTATPLGTVYVNVEE